MAVEPLMRNHLRPLGRVNEIRIQDENGAFRIMYVAKFLDAVYVLHAFQKKTQKTAKADIELARQRYLWLISSKKE